MRVCGQGPARLSGINIPVVAYLAYGSKIRFRGPIAKINISKERKALAIVLVHES